MVIPTFSSGSFERTLLSNECLTADSKSNDRRLQHRFLVLRKLGQGTYGKVQLAINKETNQEVAIKTIKKGKIESEEDMLRIRREIHIMKSIRHPYIIHIHEVFETRQKIVIVMQYASGGELYDYLGCHNSLPEEEARRIFRQIASAIYYCHKNKICHRDLKLENILLDDVGNAQIADFGLSNIFDEKRRMNTFCGSPLYASPEIVKGTPYKGPEVDCWSLGVLLYTLIYGTMPFDGRNFKELVTQISEGRYEEPSNKSSASTLIRRLLTPDISRRATITDVCQDSWVNEGFGTSLLNIAEKMAWDANLKTKSLSLSKFALEQNGQEKAIPAPVLIVKKPNITQSGTVPETSHSLNGHNGEVSRNSDLYEQILNYDVKFIINKLLGAVESSVCVSQNKPITPALTLPIKENGVTPHKPWPQNGESNVASKVESAYVIPIFEVTSVVPKTNKIIRKRNSLENTEQCSKQLPNGIIHKNNDGIIQKEGKSKPTTEKKDTSKENQEQTKTEPEKSTDKPQQKRQQDQSKYRRNNENFKFASKHLGPFFKNNALTLARIFSAKYERLVRTSIKLPERKRPVPGKLVIPSTFDPTTASCNEAAQKKEQILLFPTVSVSENKEKIEKKIDKIKKAALNRNLILRSNSQNRLKIQKFLLSQAKKMQDFMCDEQCGGNGSMHHLNKCDIPPEVYHLFDKTPMNAFGTRQHSKRINFNDFGKNCDFDLARRKMFRVNYLSIKNEGSLSIAKSKSDVQFPTYFGSSDQHYGNLLDVPHCATIQRSASDSEGLQIFRNAFEYIKHCENNKNDFEMSYKIPNSVYDQHWHEKGHLTVSSQLTKENIQGTSRRFMEKDNHTNGEEESKAVPRSNSISICTDLLNTSSNFSFIRKQLPSFNILGKENNKYLLNNKNDTVATKKLKSFLSKVNVFYGKQNELLKEQILKRRNSLSSIPDRKFLFQEKKYHNMNIFGKEKDEISFENRFAVLSEQSLSMNHSKDEANFLSSPNLYRNAFESINQSRYNDRKSIDSLNSRLSSSIDSEEFDFLPSMRRSSQTSQFLRKILHDSFDNDNVDSELIPTRVRAKSLVEGAFSSDDMVRKLSNSHGVGQNKFLSKFLNELENRESSAIKKDPKLNRRHSRNLSLSGKKPKLEKRSKSFLQLLALKRIHEAEKELDKAERNHTVDAEEESAGSLLEALKTHGYKGVISQLSQESENNSTDPYNTSSYLSRKRALDLHRYNTSYYDPMQQFTYPSYDLNNLDLASYDALEFSPYNNNLDLTPYNSLDNDYNNLDLTYNLDQTPYNFELTPYNFDLTSYNTSDSTPYSNNLELTSYNNGLDEMPYTTLDSSYSLNYKSNSPKQNFSRLPTQPSEHRSKFTFEMPEEPNASDTPNWERDPKPDDLVQSQEALNEQGNQKPIKKYSITELPTYTSPRTEKNPLLRASSTSEDERESVQDRIWRKSFYSRFNNSALSRKERSSLLDSEFSPEVRANGICTPFKSSHRDHSKWQSSKRVETARKYSLTRDSSVASSRSRQRSYDISDENISKMDSDI